jgi:lipoyl-dependent peroxiredoxin
MPSPTKILYTAEAVSSGDGRDGHVTSSDKRIDLDLAFPPEMGGSGDGTNPEQLFAAGFATCFHSALRFVARQAKADTTGSVVTARVGIGPEADSFALAVTLLIELPNVEPEQAHALAEAAHQECPYAKATRGNIDVNLQLATTPALAS